MRLNRFLAQTGLASRRKCDKYIKTGRVKINGKTVTDFSYTVNPETDRVEVDHQPVLLPETELFIMLNKPMGYVTTVSDPQGRPTVMELLPDMPYRLYPVGRLDRDTEGLLLFTNSGQMTYHLTHPKYGVEKTYIAEVEGQPAETDLQRLRQGLLLEDGWTAPATVSILQKNTNTTCLQIVIHEGRKRQVRRMCKAIGHPVIALKRTQFGTLSLGDLSPGESRPLTRPEVNQLRRHLRLSDPERKSKFRGQK